MARWKTDGVPVLVNRLKKKTPYHKDDIRAILYAAFDEMRAMMEEGSVRCIKFERFGMFEIKKTNKRMGYNFTRQERCVIPPRYKPVFKFNKEMEEKIKKIELQDGGILP